MIKMERLFELPNGNTVACKLSGQGTPIVCIHAPCIGSTNFIYQEPLSDAYQLVIPDLPGHGASSTIRTRYSIADLAVWLDSLIQMLGLEHPIILGYSQGASIAIEYGLRYPDRVQGVILVSAFSEVNELYLHSRFLLAKAMAALHGIPLLARSTASSHLNDPTIQSQWIRHACRTDAECLKRLYAAGHLYHCTQYLHELKMPALLVYGEEDKPMHPYAHLLAKHLPDAKLTMVPGTKHQVVTRAAQSFNQLCRDFIH